MMRIRPLLPIPGVCLEACDEVTVPNAVGSKCIADNHAVYLSHNHNPPEKEWEPIPVPPPEPTKYEPSDPLEYPAGRKVAKAAAEAAEKLNPKRKKAAHEEADQG